MFKKLCSVIAIFLILIFTACSTQRSIPQKTTPAPSPVPQQNENEDLQQRDQTENQADILPKSNKEGVEENINAMDISNDRHLTSSAESYMFTQISTGVSQNETIRISNGTSGATAAVVQERYQTQLPAEITNNIQYTKYDLTYDYFLVTTEKESSIYENPDPNSKVVCKSGNGQKLALHEKVSGSTVGKSDIWYKVSCKDNGNITTGYIHSEDGLPRSFRFDKMVDAIRTLQKEVAGGKLNFISNYKNVNGEPPKKGDSATDEFGMRIYQSAPGYFKADVNSDFRYVPDGMLVKILDTEGDFYKVFISSFGKELYVPKKYIDPNVSLSQLEQVIVVDRNQQNQATFEINGNGISMVSYTFATTGLKSDKSFETPLGYFKVIEKKDRFQYLADNSDEIAGYAPFATRFCGGAYVHGVPVAYEKKDGENVDPGIQEYLQTIGTFPRSHMCVRNFTSHAEFLYNWVVPENAAVIVIE